MSIFKFCHLVSARFDVFYEWQGVDSLFFIVYVRLYLEGQARQQIIICYENKKWVLYIAFVWMILIVDDNKGW